MNNQIFSACISIKKMMDEHSIFFCGLQGAEISVTDENHLIWSEPSVWRMWKINYKNINSKKPFKIKELRVMSRRKVVRNLTALAVVFFVTVITCAGFHSGSSIWTGALTKVSVQVNIVCVLCVAQQLCLLFWRWAAQWYDGILILLPDFSTRRC